MTTAHRRSCSEGFAVLFRAVFLWSTFLWSTQFAAFADGPQRDARPASDTAGKIYADARPIPSAPRAGDLSRTIHLYGTVFGLDGHPVAGARLYLNVDEWTDPIELGTSNDDGAYHFEVSDNKLRRIVGSRSSSKRRR